MKRLPVSTAEELSSEYIDTRPKIPKEDQDSQS